MKQWCFLLVMLCALSFLPSQVAAHDLHAGDLVADFAFTDFAGNQHHLSEFGGKYVLLDFWATWCLPCLKEVPNLKTASEQFRSRGLVIIGMNSDKKPEKAEQFVRQHDVSWLQSVPTSTKQVVHDLGIQWYPALVLLDPNAKILAVSKGERPPLFPATSVYTPQAHCEKPRVFV